MRDTGVMKCMIKSTLKDTVCCNMPFYIKYIHFVSTADLQSKNITSSTVLKGTVGNLFLKHFISFVEILFVWKKRKKAGIFVLNEMIGWQTCPSLTDLHVCILPVPTLHYLHLLQCSLLLQLFQ